MSCGYEDRAYVNSHVGTYMKKTIKDGMTFTDIQQQHKDFDGDLELFNNCSKESESQFTPVIWDTHQ